MFTFNLRLKPFDIIILIIVAIATIKFVVSYFVEKDIDQLAIAIIALLLGVIYANLADLLNRK